MKKNKQIQFEFNFRPFEVLPTLTKQGASEVYSKASDGCMKVYCNEAWKRYNGKKRKN